MLEICGRVLKCGNNINTDLITPPQYLEQSLDVMALHVLEGVAEDFPARLKRGDIIAAGSNFGSGSSRETSPLAMKKAGIEAVVAQSFARIFYRNAINIGLPVLECSFTDLIMEGDILKISLESGKIENMTRGKLYQATTLSEPVAEILISGGLIKYLEQKICSGIYH